MHIYCCWKTSRGNFKDYHVSAMGLYVLLNFGQYQIYFLFFYEMNPDCYFISDREWNINSRGSCKYRSYLNLPKTTLSVFLLNLPCLKKSILTNMALSLNLAQPKPSWVCFTPGNIQLMGTVQLLELYFSISRRPLTWLIIIYSLPNWQPMTSLSISLCGLQVSCLVESKELN